MTAPAAPATTATDDGRPRLLGDRRFAAGALGLAGLLSLAMVALVLGHHQGGIGAALAAVVMTAPVAYAPMAPTAAGLTLAVAAAVNEMFFGHLARCGAALPAAFFVAFVVGYALGRCGLAALAGTAVSVVLQCVFDPRLGVGVTGLMIPLTLVFFGAGRYVRHRAAMVTSLRNSTAELHQQRERTARIAVAADREELRAQLNRTLQQRIEELARVVRVAHGAGDSRERFAMIEQLGRQTLEEMRGLLGSLRDSPTRPEPRLADLADVCARATTADVRLTVNGTPRPLPASIELSACRIVEQLLRTLPDDPMSRVELRVDVAAGGLDILVTGAPATNAVTMEHVRALAQHRAAFHGGSVDVTDRAGLRRARVWLPLVTAHG